MLYAESQLDVSAFDGENLIERGPEAIAMDCEMVGGGSDGSLDLCARVCLIDEDEKLLFHAYVEPPIPVTNYRYLCGELELVTIVFLLVHSPFSLTVSLLCSLFYFSLEDLFLSN